MDIFEKVIRDVSKEYNITSYDVERMVMSQFRHLSNVISSKGTNVISLKHLGKFVPTKSRLSFNNKDEEVNTDN